MKYADLLECWRMEVSNKKGPDALSACCSMSCVVHARTTNCAFSSLFAWHSTSMPAAAGQAPCPADAAALEPQVRCGHRHRRTDRPRHAHRPSAGRGDHSAREHRPQLFIRQNCSIGIKTLGLDGYALRIGDNVSLGANSCIIADRISIGDNVVIGAMSLVTRDIPANATFYNPRQSVLRGAPE